MENSRSPGESGVFLPLTGTMIYPNGDRVLRYLREGWFEFREMALMNLLFRPGDCVIDVGAHCGLYSRIAAQRMQGNGTIVAVEPNPAMHRFIKQNIPVTEVGPELPIAHKKVILVTAAVSTGKGDGFLRLGPADSSAYATLTGIAPGETEGLVRVATRSLESLVSDDAAGPIFIKLDVERLEYEIINAASEFLRSRSDIHLMVEFDENNLAAAGKTTAELVSLLEGLGYQLHHVDDVEIQLRRHTSQQPLWGANLIATPNPDALKHRIESVPPEILQETTDFFERGRAAEAIYRDSKDYEKLLKSIENLAPAVVNTALTLTGSADVAASTKTRFLSTRTDNGMLRADSAIHLLHDEIGRIEGMSRHVVDRIKDHEKLLKSIENLAPAVVNTALTLTGSVKVAASTKTRFLSARTGNGTLLADSAIHLLHDEIGRIEGMSRHVVDRIFDLHASLLQMEARYRDAIGRIDKMTDFMNEVNNSRWFRAVRRLFPYIGSSVRHFSVRDHVIHDADKRIPGPAWDTRGDDVVHRHEHIVTMQEGSGETPVLQPATN
jgi:FkbM family methyltransferase